MQKFFRYTLNALFLLAFLVGLVGVPALSTSASHEPRPEVIYPDRTDTSQPLRERPELPDQAGKKDLPRKVVADRINYPAPAPSLDPALSGPPGPDAGTTFFNFDGIANRNGVLPPDTNGDVGPNHYVQWVNLSLQIWSLNRTTNTATSVYGPVNGNTIWSGFGGPCQNTNNGDPIVLYDQAADRWFISQFALPNYPLGPFYQCIAVSQTPDPTGAWYRYQFTVSNTKMNDYPHFGVWPDGYYMTVNQFNQSTLTWGGAGAVVFERDKMLLGQTARMVYFDLYSVDPNLGGMLPSDLDGATPPPTGAPNVFAQPDDNAWGYPQDQLELWNFHVDWTNPANSTFTLAGKPATAAFDTNMCGGARSCITQPGTTVGLDAIAERLMYRLQYRNFGGYETLVVNHTVDVDGTDRAGVRWYELRKSGGAWSIYQQGTFSPDSTDRWMASVAMNGSGQIALGYSASSSTIYPSVRYTGRLPGDALGTMTQGENIIMAGTGNQTHSASRWGDYSSMSVDPVDDCTFWYTSEYIQTSGLANWRTRIASFQFPNCGAPVDTPPTVSITNPANGATVSGTIDITANASDDHGVNQVEFFVDGASIGSDASAPYSVSWNTTSVYDGAHTVLVRATDTIGQTGSDSHAVTVTNAAPAVIHVGDLDGTKTLAKANWKATVTVTVHDATDVAVSGVTVSFTWSGGYAATGTCTTNLSGQCSATTGTMNNKKTSVTFTVTNLAKAGTTYNSSLNHDPDGDSTGTVITITK
jgi:hypothetical protein